MRRAPASKHDRLTELKDRARALGWSSKVEDDEQGSSDNDEEDDSQLK